ncbi:hypothetical protein D3C76_1016360 [compost metagenome]
MNVAGHNNFVTRFAYRQNHSHDCTACALHTKIGMIGSECIGCQNLRFLNDTGWLMKIIQRSDVDQIYGEGIIADKFTKFGIRSQSFFMSRDMKLHRIECRVVF